MEVYQSSAQGLADMYLIQGTESNPQFTHQHDQLEVMYSEMAPDFFMDQGLYYPPATGYQYVGYESPGDWEDHQRDMLNTAVVNETLPYGYYTPSYGYGQSFYNPYNPYIPGAMLGVDAPFVAPQPYYTFPVPPPTYVPVAAQSWTNSTGNGTVGHDGVSVNKGDVRVGKQNVLSKPLDSGVGYTPGGRSSFPRVSGASRSNAGSGKHPVPNITSDSLMSRPSSQIRARGMHGTENSSNEKMSSGSGQLRDSLPFTNGRSGFRSSDHVPKIHYGRAPDDALNEQNQRLRTYKSRNQLVVKAYTTRAGNPDPQGNITIYMDHYNRSDFPLMYINAKFFVIKSYSEDDVHKSIKYNVWSSTPNGNTKLNTAYEDAQRMAAVDPRGCPIFLFFSVNASGQFCGIAEMTGPVDFHKDMDFWQQDKWNGSFPVKWHVIKDVPNPNFRHIILENNENKPVTNSRDTQEISYEKGLEMMQIFKNYTLRTSLLDDFMYYEKRQRILQEERARRLIRNYENSYIVPRSRIQSFQGREVTKHDVINLTSTHRNDPPPSIGGVSIDSTTVNEGSEVSADNGANELKLGSLTLNSKEPESVVTIGSMPVKVNGAESSGFLTVGTIPLDPRALRRD